MMINRRLIDAVPESKPYIAGNVVSQWISLGANIAIMGQVSAFLQSLNLGNVTAIQTAATAVGILVAVMIRCICAVVSSQMSFYSSRAVKKQLRQEIYRKLLRLGGAYNRSVTTSQVVQMAVEGVDQLETYFGSYLPQFFYAMLAPLTLFVVLSRISLPSALVLLVCVPLIPVTIVAVQRWAKKLLSKYWGQYTALGDTFLENLQGLTTSKVYGADEFKHRQMNEQSERFRIITMKVLTMQLNSITIMDAIAYGGAALGILLAVLELRAGRVDLGGCLMILLLAADFFLPMRTLGSFFHIAMNGMAASDRIFTLLDLPEKKMGEEVPENAGISCENLCFSYEQDRQILHDVTMTFPEGGFTAIVGESGCGKSTVASLLLGRNPDYAGKITIGGKDLPQIGEEALLKHITYVSHQSYLFRGTVRENLLMAAPDATDEMLWQVLERAQLAGFLRGEQGLDTLLQERGSNFSGGQCQRLALARALLHDSPVYLFDESTSNVDVESENAILQEIRKLAGTKTVILISHRLANVVTADNIYVMERGRVAESGTHSHLLECGGVYANLWQTQQQLERYARGEKS